MRLWASVAVATLMTFRPVAAAETAKDFAGFSKYERYYVRYDVNADGTHVESHEWALKVLGEQGVESANDASISYSDTLQDSEILEAYTLKRDGRRLDAPPANFQVERNEGKPDASPMFSDIKTKTVVFPDVAVGDTVVLSYRLTQKEAMFPGNFSIAQPFSKFFVYDDAKIVVTAPKSLELQVQSRGVEGGETAGGEDRRQWEWTYRNQAIALPESAAISPLDYGPLIVVSTFPDYGTIARAYQERAAPKARVTDATQKLADELTRDAKTAREQARLLYEWLLRNVKFAGNCVGVGSVVPHDADRVLETRMGDCKDHAALYESLLTAKGIASTPVLINAGTSYELPEVATTAVFNHVINYIPALDLYADSGATFTPFGSLPSTERGKPVLHTADFTAVRRTPQGSWRDNRSRTKTRLRMRADGTADGESEIELTGDFAIGVRSWMNYLRPDMEDRTMRRILSANGYSGTGTITKSDPMELSEDYRYGSRYHLDDALNLPGPGAIYVHSPFTSAGAIGTFLGAINEPDKTLDYLCGGGISIEQYVIELPKGVEVLAWPKDVKLAAKHAAYRSQYRAKGRTVTVTRELEDRTEGNVCSPADFADFKAFAVLVRKDLRKQVVYR